MHRKKFISLISGAAIIPHMNSFSELKKFTDSLDRQGNKMPVLFIGHGSPMNGIEDNEFSRGWSAIAAKMPVPKAVLVISAHWFTRGTRITAMDFPKTIHDFGGFPEALFKVEYPAPGDPQLAGQTAAMVRSAPVALDHEWGLDHGAWTVVRHMYPKANIPVLQLSIDYTKNAAYHYELARELFDLRSKGVLIIGSGNMVHNLGMVAWDKLDLSNYAYDWALEANDTFKRIISAGSYDKLIHYEGLGKEVALAIPSPDHFLPLIYALGLKSEKEDVHFFNDKAVGGSITMTSLKIGA
jgi:4,5-DOPA dioxygenase extradiol